LTHLIEGSGEEHSKSGNKRNSSVSAGGSNGDTHEVLLGNEALNVAFSRNLPKNIKLFISIKQYLKNLVIHFYNALFPS